MKQNLRVLLVLALVLCVTGSAWAFTDTEDLNDAEQAAISYLSERGVVSGYTDGSFQPANAVTRAEFAKMVCVFAGYEELTEGESLFADVPATEWYYGWVNQAAAQGLVQGANDGRFQPEATISQQEIATILLRLSGLDEEGLDWPADYISAARERGLDADFDFDATAAASRLIACQMLYNLVEDGVGVAEQEPEELPLSTYSGTLRGVVTVIEENEIILVNAEGDQYRLRLSAARQPEGLIPGAYLELRVSNGSVGSVAECILPERGTVYWEVSQDGRSLTVDRITYDITEAEIFQAQYGINQGYSEESFISGGPVNLGVLSLGGTIGADMAVVVSARSNQLQVAYLVNATINTGANGRIDAVRELTIEDGEARLSFLGRAGDLVVAPDIVDQVPERGVLVYFTYGDTEITSITPLLDISGNGTVADLSTVFADWEEPPYQWVGGGDGLPLEARPTWGMVYTNVEDFNLANRTVTLGPTEYTRETYKLASDCLVFVVARNGRVTAGTFNSTAHRDYAVALLNTDGEIAVIYVFNED